MPRFFITEDNIKEKDIIIKGEDFHHIINVLRYKNGNNLSFSDGKKIYNAKICEIKKDYFICEILNIEENKKRDRGISIHLYQAIAKGEKMDFIIQKTTELGVSTITPIITKNTIVKLNENEDSKIKRWQKISDEASSQSERIDKPIIKNTMKFEEALSASINYGTVLFCYERCEGNYIKNTLENICDKNISIFIGPEGGFSKEEIDIAKNMNVRFVSLGDTILRTETAAIISVALTRYELTN